MKILVKFRSIIFLFETGLGHGNQDSNFSLDPINNNPNLCVLLSYFGEIPSSGLVSSKNEK
jgi:hypothetical protein